MESNKHNKSFDVTKKEYKKIWLSYDEQYSLLYQRGMSFENYSKDKALRKLEFIGYYRLSGYSHAFRCSPSDEKFIEGTKFKDIIELYKFDRKLKLLLLDAIERIEVAVRACLAYQLSNVSVSFIDSDSNFELDRIVTNNNNRRKNKKTGGVSDTLKVKNVLHDLREKISEKINSSSRKNEPAIEHLISTYKEPYPLWITIQIFDFSDLCNLYQIISLDLAKNVSNKFGVVSPAIFLSWLQSIRVVRNICAHHGRLVNRNLSVLPKIPNVKEAYKWIALWKSAEFIDKTKIFSIICILHHILNNIQASKSWDNRIVQLLNEFPKIDIEKFDSVKKVLGCPEGWENIGNY